MPPPSSNHFPVSPPSYHDRDRDAARRSGERLKEREIREREAAAADYKRRQNMGDYVSCFFFPIYCCLPFLFGDRWN